MLSFKKIMKNIDAIRAGATKPSSRGLEWEIALEMTQGCGAEWYGFVYWTPADVILSDQGLPKISEEEAEKWLLEHEDAIAEAMVIEGNYYLGEEI